jgi:hypothetical protein
MKLLHTLALAAAVAAAGCVSVSEGVDSLVGRGVQWFDAQIHASNLSMRYLLRSSRQVIDGGLGWIRTKH